MKKDNKNSNDLMMASVALTGFGVVALPFTAAVGIGCIGTGIVGLAAELGTPLLNILTKRKEYSEEVEKIIEIIRINEVENKEGTRMKIENITQTIYGLDIEFNIPLGLRYKDLDDIIPAISCAFSGKDISRDKNKLMVKFTELKEAYDLIFPPIRKDDRNKLMTYIGENLEGPVKLDLSQAGGILIAGQTGAGKSTALRYMLTHIAMNYKREELNLYLNDMKFSELFLFKNLKITRWHNTNPDLVELSLDNFWKEIQRRYKLFEKYECTDAYTYEEITGNKIPINLMVIEEFTLLSGKKYKNVIEKLNDILCQCRASKSHVIITTQRPDAKTLDPRLKANITHTIGLRTKSIINSQIICDSDILKYLRGNGHGYVFDRNREIEFQAYNLDPEFAKSILEKYNKSKKEMQEEHENLDGSEFEREYITLDFPGEDEGDEF